MSKGIVLGNISYGYHIQSLGACHFIKERFQLFRAVVNTRQYSKALLSGGRARSTLTIGTRLGSLDYI